MISSSLPPRGCGRQFGLINASAGAGKLLSHCPELFRWQLCPCATGTSLGWGTGSVPLGAGGFLFPWCVQGFGKGWELLPCLPVRGACGKMQPAAIKGPQITPKIRLPAPFKLEGKVQLLGRAAVALQGPALSPSTSPHLSKAAFFQLSKSIWWVETPPGGAPPAVKGSGCSNQGFSPFGHCFQLGLEEAGAASPQGAGSGVQIG